jgi:hypothetical protein
MIPFLIVLAAGLLTRGRDPHVDGRWGRGGRRARLLTVAGLATLVFLWWVDLPEVSALIRLAVSGGEGAA